MQSRAVCGVDKSWASAGSVQRNETHQFRPQGASDQQMTTEERNYSCFVSSVRKTSVSEEDVFAQDPAYLSQAYLPFNVVGDPTQPNFSIPNIELNTAIADRVDNRMKLLGSLDRTDRRRLLTRARPEDVDRRDRRVRSHTANRKLHRFPDRCHAARSRSLAAGDVAHHGRRRHLHRSNRRLNQFQRGTSG